MAACLIDFLKSPKMSRRHVMRWTSEPLIIFAYSLQAVCNDFDVAFRQSPPSKAPNQLPVVGDALDVDELDEMFVHVLDSE